MKKKTMKIAIGALACLLCIAPIIGGLTQKKIEEQPMKKQLVNNETLFVVAEVKGDKIKFNDPALEEQMKQIGVFIPPSQQHKYHGKTSVTLDDPDFIRAFEELYLPSNLFTDSYSWKEPSND